MSSDSSPPDACDVARKLSFIIPAHDEALQIGATLEAVHVAAQGLGGEYEIIVVDDASTDATATIAQALGARVETVAFRHIAATRNAGARLARFERLVFVDADTRITPALLSAAMAALDAGAVGGGATVRLEGERRWSIRLITALMMQVFRWTRIAPGCFVFCRRDTFELVGGFDESMFAAEDIALSRALAGRGEFLILRQAVFTSNRKVSSVSGLRAHLHLAVRFLRTGPSVLRSREHLGLWYEKDARGGEGPHRKQADEKRQPHRNGADALRR